MAQQQFNHTISITVSADSFDKALEWAQNVLNHIENCICTKASIESIDAIATSSYVDSTPTASSVSTK